MPGDRYREYLGTSAQRTGSGLYTIPPSDLRAASFRGAGTAGPGPGVSTATDRRRCLPPLLPCPEVLPGEVPGDPPAGTGVLR